jgi:hypothetical protein
MKKIIVIEKLNFFSLLASFWLRVNRYEIYHFGSSNFPTSDWWLDFLAIKKCNFSDSNNLNPGSYLSDKNYNYIFEILFLTLCFQHF